MEATAGVNLIQHAVHRGPPSDATQAAGLRPVGAVALNRPAVRGVFEDGRLGSTAPTSSFSRSDSPAIPSNLAIFFSFAGAPGAAPRLPSMRRWISRMVSRSTAAPPDILRSRGHPPLVPSAKGALHLSANKARRRAVRLACGCVAPLDKKRAQQRRTISERLVPDSVAALSSAAIRSNST